MGILDKAVDLAERLIAGRLEAGHLVRMLYLEVLANLEVVEQLRLSDHGVRSDDPGFLAAAKALRRTVLEALFLSQDGEGQTLALLGKVAVADEGLPHASWKGARLPRRLFLTWRRLAALDAMAALHGSGPAVTPTDFRQRFRYLKRCLRTLMRDLEGCGPVRPLAAPAD